MNTYINFNDYPGTVNECSRFVLFDPSSWRIALGW